jgi:hypothetical protein
VSASAPERWCARQIVEVPRPEAQIETAAIPKRSLIAAADDLGVRTQRGQRWLPG